MAAVGVITGMAIVVLCHKDNPEATLLGAAIVAISIGWALFGERFITWVKRFRFDDGPTSSDKQLPSDDRERLGNDSANVDDAITVDPDGGEGTHG